MTSLTKEIVKAAAATGSKYRLADHKVNGLHLRVSPAGVKTYVIMYSDIAGARRECVVGRADVLALDDARDIARTMLGDRARGVDPLQAKADAREQERKRRTSTLRSFADDWEALQCLKGKRESTRKYEHYLLRKIIIPNIGDLPLAEIRRADVLDLMQIRIDLTSAFNLCRLTIESMRERNFGRIINISSINGQKGQIGQVNYSAAKAGLIGFTKALAQENAKKGITVNVICPGYIDTEMVQAVPEKVLEGIVATIPVGRLGKAEEIAGCVSFLAGADSAFMTGATLTANGGQYITG